jgi:hypothetical protein
MAISDVEALRKQWGNLPHFECPGLDGPQAVVVAIDA